MRLGIFRRLFRGRRHRRGMIAGAILLVVLFLLFPPILRARAAPMALPIFESIAESRVQKLIRRVAEERIASGEYGEFCSLRYGADGRLQGLTVDSREVGRYAADLSQALEEELAGMKLTCEIRSGDIILPRFFSGSGFALRIHGSLYGGATARTCSSLEEGGLNQTLHRLELEVSVPLTLTVLGKETQLTVTSRILISEAVLVGALPGGVVVG